MLKNPLATKQQKQDHDFIFHSKRLKAKKFVCDDDVMLNRLHSDEVVMTTTSGTVQTIAQTQKELQEIIEHDAKYGVSQMAFFDHEEKFVGRCGIIYRNFASEDDYNYEVRYAIHRAFQGLGMGTEMLSSYLNYIFFQPEIHIDKVIAGVRLDGHKASEKLLIKLGFIYTGNKIFRGNGKETKMYEMKKSDW